MAQRAKGRGGEDQSLPVEFKLKSEFCHPPVQLRTQLLLVGAGVAGRETNYEVSEAAGKCSQGGERPDRPERPERPERPGAGGLSPGTQTARSPLIWAPGVTWALSLPSGACASLHKELPAVSAVTVVPVW